MATPDPEPAPSKAFVVRVAPNRLTLLDDCLKHGQIVIGWPEATGLANQLDWPAFRGVVAGAYYADQSSLRKAGAAAGHLWRFIHEIAQGDLVVVPAAQGRFFVGEIAGPAQEIAQGEVGYSRTVRWLNDGQPIDRRLAGARLQSRMKVYGSTAGATDLVADIRKVLSDTATINAGGETPTFESDLREQLILATLSQMREGRVDSFKFEHIVRTVLMSLGAVDASITSRRLDKGDDIVADFKAVGEMFDIKVCVQVKHYNEVSRPLEQHVVDEVLAGMKKVDADLGIIATAGTVSEGATAYVEALANEGERIVILDGRQLASLYLDHCIGRRAV